MAELISVPLKKPSDVDVVKPLKNLIQARYSTADKPEDYSDAINEFSKLRTTAIWKAFEKYESSLDVIYSYYDQLVALEAKIPAQEVTIPFKWKDAFQTGSIFGGKVSLTVPSLAYEKICVLFNIAALQSSVAAAQSIENDDGLKLAAKLLQQAAGNFNHLKSISVLSIQQEPTPDLNPDTLGALSSLMLAQAQEIFVFKAIHDEMKDVVIAKLASQAEDLYSECHKVFNRDALRSLWEREWLNMISAKQCAYQAIAHFYQSLVCKSKKAVGEEITWLNSGEELFKQAHAKAGRAIFQDLYSRLQRNLAEAKKDNDFIYHERIPDIKSLTPVGKAQLAKLIPPGHPLSANFRDLFNDLVPVGVHQALAAYDLRKSELVHTEIGKLRESTQLLNSLLASLNLPAAIESTKGNTLPPSIIEKHQAVQSLGGIKALETMITDLPELLKRNQDILDESERMLNEEASADKSLRDQFKEKWTRTPSEKLTEMFVTNISKYRQLINNAVQADKTIREKFEKHRPGVENLSKPIDELQSIVPTSGGGSVADTSAVATLRQLMEEVETIKAERDVIESELNGATTDMKDQFMSALAADGAINEPALSLELLGKTYGPLQKQVKESVAKQSGLVENIRQAHNQFVQERGNAGSQRDDMMSQLAAAHDAYRELLNNLKEGTKFYNELTQLLINFQNKISDFCFARKTEKEELLKDLTQESSRQAPADPPAQPAYHKEPTPAAPAAPSSAPSGSSQLPYPVYTQGMPVPYGATANTPYPSYAPPPMPQGYNPYGTMPYPSNFNYPGTFPQPYQQPPPGGYPQGYQPPPPGAYQQHPPGGHYQGWQN